MVAAWQHDQQHGLDSLMLASYRHHVADLNGHARDTRLRGHVPAREVELADGNHASTGDVIITRRNDRRLGTGPNGSSWVRNGARWTITGLTDGGGITATHRRTGHEVTLPAGYVRDAVELGYATTIHAAQGVTSDTTHCLVTSTTSREQLYTMVSRGRSANQLNLAVGDADSYRILDADADQAPADIMRQILRRSDQLRSATSVRRYLDQTAPAANTPIRALEQVDHPPSGQTAPHGRHIAPSR